MLLSIGADDKNDRSFGRSQIENDEDLEIFNRLSSNDEDISSVLIPCFHYEIFSDDEQSTCLDGMHDRYNS